MADFENANRFKAYLETELDKGGREYLNSAEILQTVSLVIYRDRKDKKLTQKEYAKSVGVSQVMISKIESGNYNPTIEFLSKLAYKLNFTFKINFGPADNVYAFLCAEDSSFDKEDFAKRKNEEKKRIG